jgi:hypothetical protein
VDLPHGFASARLQDRGGHLMGLGSDHWTSRFRTEEILEVECPKCGALPHKWCNREGEKLGRRARAMLKAGTPPSHQERMWLRQGHDEREFPALLARQRPGWEESAPRAGIPGKGSLSVVPSQGGCGPCARERILRQGLPGFPLDFSCRHARNVAPVTPSYPQRYRADRHCPQCKFVTSVQVVVQSPAVIGYRCDRGHMWLATTGSCATGIS